MFCIYTAAKFGIKRKAEFKPLVILSEFFWILNILAIMKITGIMEGIFGITSPFDGNVHISFGFFEEGLSMAALLNIALFIPFGFFSLAVFRRLKNRWFYGILIGLIFSIIIEFLQSFTGRFVQLDDLVMNTLGAFLGYEICLLFLKLKHQPEDR